MDEVTSQRVAGRNRSRDSMGDGGIERFMTPRWSEAAVFLDEMEVSVVAHVFCNDESQFLVCIVCSISFPFDSSVQSVWKAVLEQAGKVGVCDCCIQTSNGAFDRRGYTLHPRKVHVEQQHSRHSLDRVELLRKQLCPALEKTKEQAAS